jgi:4-hydroxybenzoate polyprenyltransferase
MSEQLAPGSSTAGGSDKTLRSVGVIACTTAFLAFMAGAGVLFLLPSHAEGMAGLNLPAVFLGLLATISGAVGIYTLNRYAALHLDDQDIALWTNLFCRVMAMVELFSMAAVLAWLILHFIGLPVISHLHRFHQ